MLMLRCERIESTEHTPRPRLTDRQTDEPSEMKELQRNGIVPPKSKRQTPHIDKCGWDSQQHNSHHLTIECLKCMPDSSQQIDDCRRNWIGRMSRCVWLGCAWASPPPPPPPPISLALLATRFASGSTEHCVLRIQAAFKCINNKIFSRVEHDDKI